MVLNGRGKRLLSYAMALVALILLFSPGSRSTSLGQIEPAYVRLVRVIETDALGIPNPAGLAFSPGANAFHVVEARLPGQPPPATAEVTRIDPFGQRGGSARIAAAIEDPLNVAFDSQANRLLILQSAGNTLIEVREGPDGDLDPTTLMRHDARRFALENPRGMTVDPASGRLLILDSAAPRIVRVEPAPDGGFDGATISQVDLRQPELIDVQGLAMDPTTGHLFVLSGPQKELYELTQTGQLVARRDLSGFDLGDLEAVVFAPSGDLTDDPSRMSLYLAKERGGSILELSFVRPVAPQTDPVPSVLVQTIDTSLWFPPSPDPSGIVYLPASETLSETLLVSDAEVEETVPGQEAPAYWYGGNLFASTLTGTLNFTSSTTLYSNEPTGATLNPANAHLFVSDDSAREVFEIDPGDDGLYDTPDDVRSSFVTHLFGSYDPEGLTFDSLQGALFIVDGINSEVYRVHPGDNGIFEGVPGDDVVTSFDTASLGLINPEGIAFDSDGGHLYIVGQPKDRLFHVSTAGALVRTIDFAAANPDRPAGLAYAPGSQDPLAMHIYVTDRGVDNNSDPFENDGKVYELAFSPVSLGNLPPAAAVGADQIIAWPATAVLDGTVSDDGLPNPPAALTTTWSLVNGTSIVTFTDASAVDTTVSFATPGIYVLRLSADDTELTASDEMTVTVAGETPVDVRVAASADDAEEAEVAGPINPAGHVSRSSADLELVFDMNRGNQTVGMRFNGVEIPPGEFIADAYVQFKAAVSDSQLTSLTIEGEAVDNATAFTSELFNISSRPRTTAAVPWSPANWDEGAAGVDERTPNIAPIIQELVNRPGWSSGNSLVIIITGSGQRTAVAWNADPAAAPLLHVVYDTTPKYMMPRLAGIPDQVFGHGTLRLPRNIELWDYVADVDTPVEQLTFAISGTPPVGAGVTLSGTHAVRVDPSAAWCGYTDVTVRVSDPDEHWDTDTFRVAATWSCQGPLPVANQAAPHDQPIILDLTAYEPQVGNGTGMVWYVTGEEHCTVNGAYSADDLLTFVPEPGFVGVDTVTLHMIYPWGSEATQELTLAWDFRLYLPLLAPGDH